MTDHIASTLSGLSKLRGGNRQAHQQLYASAVRTLAAGVEVAELGRLNEALDALELSKQDLEQHVAALRRTQGIERELATTRAEGQGLPPASELLRQLGEEDARIAQAMDDLLAEKRKLEQMIDERRGVDQRLRELEASRQRAADPLPEFFR
ncbi:MAG: hypothetical protein ACLFV3_13035 [Phycisphaeraceae bacterium]